MARLWEKGTAVNEAILAFTVGNDPELDRELLPWDCIGSAAHARMLVAVGLLQESEGEAILAALATLFRRARGGSVEISAEEEDCHTAIENYLTQELGDLGGRIHTGRSRNDQVLLATRLLMRSAVAEHLDLLSNFARSLSDRYGSDGSLPLPGYTHLMPAMPASVGMWLHAFFEGVLGLMTEGLTLLDRINSNPLGAGSGFDAPLPLDKALVARLLHMPRFDRSPIDAQNSRGRTERKVVFWLTEVGALLEKLAWDLQLFNMREFGLVSLPVELTTGSSLMPQKRNPDVLELMRARASKLRGAFSELAWVGGKLPSNYHRDYQLTKEPLLRACKVAREMLTIAPLVITGMKWDSARLHAMMHDELYVTYEAFRRVGEGIPFREAYRETAHAHAAGTIDIPPLRAKFAEVEKKVEEGMRAAQGEFVKLTGELQGRIDSLQEIERTIFTPAPAPTPRAPGH